MGFYYLLITILLPLVYFIIHKSFPHLSLKSKMLVLVAGYAGSFFFPFLISYLNPVWALVLVLSGGCFYNYFLARNIAESSEDAQGDDIRDDGKSGEDDSFFAYDEAEAMAMASAINFSGQTPGDNGWEVIIEEEDNLVGIKDEKVDALPSLKEAPLMEAADSFDNISSLIAKGFNARKKKEWEEATSLFEQAFSQAEGFELKGMILSELLYLYKELGCYKKAISILDGYLKDSSGKISANLESHLGRTIKYFQALDSLLQKSGQSDLPFSAVPQLIKLKAEEAYQS